MPQDLDQGGVFTQWSKIYYGPTLGWYYVPVLSGNLSNIVLGTTQLITSGGTTVATPGASIIEVNANANVTIQLNTSVPGNQPTQYLGWPIIITDIGGFAGAHNITILPFGAETIMGLASLIITVNFGSFTLLPKAGGGWGTI